MTSDDLAVAARAYRVIVQAERLVADLEAHTDILARFIEEERAIREGWGDESGGRPTTT